MPGPRKDCGHCQRSTFRLESRRCMMPCIPVLHGGPNAPNVVLYVLQANMDRLQLVSPAVAGYPLPLRLTPAAGYEMPLDEAVGPMFLTQVHHGCLHQQHQNSMLLAPMLCKMKHAQHFLCIRLQPRPPCWALLLVGSRLSASTQSTHAGCSNELVG